MSNEKILFVRSDHAPFSVFIIQTKNQKIVGKKHPIKNGQRNFYGPFISSNMLLGELIEIKNQMEGHLIKYNPLNELKLKEIFYSISVSDEITFPLKLLLRGKEVALSNHYWQSVALRPDILDEEEKRLREYTIQALGPFLKKNDIVFDPACSTGAFLSHLKKQYPFIHTIGQDRNADMVKIAGQKLDEAFIGDSLHPACNEESVDMVICRYLNLKVLTTPNAQLHFASVGKTLKKGGFMIVIGVTPVLLNTKIMEAHNYKVISKTNRNPTNGQLFQLYLLKKKE